MTQCTRETMKHRQCSRRATHMIRWGSTDPMDGATDVSSFCTQHTKEAARRVFAEEWVFLESQPYSTYRPTTPTRGTDE